LQRVPHFPVQPVLVFAPTVERRAAVYGENEVLVRVALRVNDRDRRDDLALLARLNSLLSRKDSLLWLQKFPVPLRREFGCKPLN